MNWNPDKKINSQYTQSVSTYSKIVVQYTYGDQYHFLCWTLDAPTLLARYPSKHIAAIWRKKQVLSRSVIPY